MNEIAHQYKIRLEKSEKEIVNFSLNEVKLKNTVVKQIDKTTAKNIIIEYEWLKTIPHQTSYHFGLYFNINGIEYLGGVLIYSQDYAENTGVWEKYGFKNKLILLSRGVCLWWTPKNSASYFISKTVEWLKNNTEYRIITATVDPAAGEIGTIYQSLNWKYVGLMTGNYRNNKETKRFSVLINGKLRYSRSIRKEFGCMKREVILEKYPDAVFIPQYRKRRYFYFIGSKSEKKRNQKKIKHLFLPYPKRNQEISGLIYMIKNITNNKIYIGQTTRAFNERIQNYENWLGNDYLNNSIKKYGWDNFEFSIIDTAKTIDELNKKEIQYINKFNSRDRNFGYNIEFGGRNSQPSKETLVKMSEAHKGIKQSNEWINKRVAIKGSEEAKKYGKLKTEEEKKYLSENSPKFWKNKNRSEETKRKISETKKNNGLSEKTKKAICKKVIAYEPYTDRIIDIYDSSTEAAKHYPISQSTISRRCSGKTKNKGDIFFKYLN
jgi:group I intron endonuclease